VTEPEYYLAGKAMVSHSMKKLEERTLRCSKAGMSEAVTFPRVPLFDLRNILLLCAFPSQSRLGTLSKCLLIQISHAVFQFFPFLYPFESWRTPIPEAI
jgi:hypothetical protein